MLMESHVTFWRSHIWTFTAKQCCSILLNNWNRWGLFDQKRLHCSFKVSDIFSYLFSHENVSFYIWRMHLCFVFHVKIKPKRTKRRTIDDFRCGERIICRRWEKGRMKKSERSIHPVRRQYNIVVPQDVTAGSSCCSKHQVSANTELSSLTCCISPLREKLGLLIGRLLLKS